MPRRGSALLLGCLILASPLLAGCLASAPGPLTGQDVGSVTTGPTLNPRVAFSSDGRVLDPSGLPADLRSTVPALLDTGYTAGEPTLGVTSDGSLYYVTISFDNPDLPTDPLDRVIKSTDQGATWTDVTPRLPTGQHDPPFSRDPLLVVDPNTDRIFHLAQDPQEACNWLVWSDDGGQTWSTNPAACGLPGNDHPTLAAGPSAAGTPTFGYPDIVYLCENHFVGAASLDTYCARSLDGGMSFSQSTLVYPGVDPTSGAMCSGLTGHVHVGPNGTVYVPRGYCGTPEVAVSHDDGLTWTRVVVNATLGITHHDASLATDEAGNAYYLWVGADGLPYLSVSTDQGATWSSPRMVGAPNVTAANLPQIAARGVGKVAFVTYGTTYPGGYGPPPYNRSLAAATWNGYLTVIPDALSPHPTVVTSMVNDPGDPLFRGACGPGRCGYVFDFIGVTIDHQGRPWGAFVDTCTSAKCLGPRGTPRDSTDEVGLVGTLASGPALVTGGGALPLLGNLTRS